VSPENPFQNSMIQTTYDDTDCLVLFASCFLTEGHNRCTINDTDRCNTYIIPKELFNLFRGRQSFNLNQTLSENIENENIQGYIDFLLGNGICFIAPNNLAESFPAINNQYINPYHITNAIVDINTNTDYLISFLEDVHIGTIPVLQLRFFSESITRDTFFSILDIIESSKVESLQVVLSSNVIDIDDLTLLNKYQKFDLLYLYGADYSITVPNQKYGLIHLSNMVNSPKCCGVVSQEHFSTNIETYTESVNNNSCLNRKISIDVDGYIKNCPSMLNNYGKITETSIADVLNNQQFKKYWNINKDSIKTCKDCEFRYICTDCRAFIEDPEDLHSKPLKCGYSPYTNEWTEWSSNPLKKAAIDFYGL
jgi:SPASM domain peptide maturase of grasp-with-spasm system